MRIKPLLTANNPAPIPGCHAPEGCCAQYCGPLDLALSIPKYCKHLDVVYYESIKREPKRRDIYECRCDERLKTKAEESTSHACTGGRLCL